MTDIDELDINPFFRLLQTTYYKIYEQAQENRYVVCVPQTSSLSGVHISQRFVETHILKPSPYFKSEFVSLASQNQIVHLDENGKEFQTKEGFPQEKSIAILSEELGYNKEYKPYKILILTEPLDGSSQNGKVSEDENKTEDTCGGGVTFRECQEFLHSYAEYRQIIRTLEDSLQVFNANYMVLKDYLDDVKQKLQQISSDATEGCCKCTKMSLWSDPRFKDILSVSVESVVMGTVHRKVFPVVCEKFSSDDKELHRKSLELQDVLPSSLGVDPKLSCPLPGAIGELGNLQRLQTPLEKLHCLKSTVEKLTSEIQVHIEANRPPPISPHIEDSVPCLTSDDLIPILVTVIAKTKCPHLASNLFYMEYFHWATDTKDRDSLSYYLVSFKAAVEYMKNTDFEFLKEKNKMHKKVNSTSSETKSFASKTTNGGRRNGATREVVGRGAKVDKKVSEISEMLRDSSLDWEKQKKGRESSMTQSIFGEDYTRYQKTPDSMPRKETRQKKEKFGDFLSSLDDDMFEVSFGKQT